ncbi:MAG TPA: TetR/AcrR family transcriptional regulator [Conexibacter sp.]|nr:TetR/AcrR family transcriptional regulator [Conexibacter sp.]
MPPTPMSTASATAPREGTGRWNDVAEAALTLFSDRGYHGTTMKHVAAELGVQAPSLYNHVGSKQEILARLMKTGMERMIAKQDEALASTDDVVEQLRRMTEAHVLVHTSHRRSALIGDRELRNLEEPARTEQRGRRELYERRFRDTIERGVLQGAFKVNSAKLASFAIIEMATSVAVWFRDEGPLSETDVAHEYGEMALRIVGVGR